MEKITKNTLVTIAMKIESKNGDFLDDSDQLMYLHGGYGQIFQKVEEALEGKQVGEFFEVLLNPADAFGEFKESLIVKEPLEELPEDIEVGMELEVEDELNIWVVENIENGFATLNANHELAGVALKISGEVLELQYVSDEVAEEILNMEDEH